MSLPTGDLQAAAISRYRSDTTLQGLLGGSSPEWSVYDAGGVPTNTSFPYLVLFPITSYQGQAFALGTDSVDTYMQAAAYAQAGGMKQARAIMKRVYDLTQERAFDLSGAGFNQYSALFDHEREREEDDGITQSVIHRYKFATTG